LEEEIRFEQKKLYFVVAAVRETRDFFEIVDDFKTYFDDRLPSLLSDPTTQKEKLIRIYRDVHTFKGLFSQQDFLSIPDALHRLETDLSSLKQKGEHGKGVLNDIMASNTIQAAFKDDMAIIKKMLGKHFLERRSAIEVPLELLENLEGMADNLLAAGAIQSNKEIKYIFNEIKKLRFVNFKTLLSEYPNGVMKLASKLEKEIQPFDIEGDDILVNPHIYSPFTKTLIHVFRNAVDHGIELPEEREESDKEACAVMTCRLNLKTDEKNQIEIIISDDGRGIDKEALIEKIVQLGIMDARQIKGLSDSDIYALIFKDDITTHDSATRVSGRGIGLSAVKAALDTLGGTVSVSTRTGTGTSFVFQLPLTGS